LPDVYRIAHLARLEIDAAHAEEVRAKLASIFGLIDELTAVDTTGVAPMAHAQDATLPLREDVVSGGGRVRPLPGARACGGRRALSRAEGPRVECGSRLPVRSRRHPRAFEWRSGADG
jgi:aspartyl/glutamyl-tRNA(Asn/Gln) amidotransferase C subunit